MIGRQQRPIQPPLGECSQPSPAIKTSDTLPDPGFDIGPDSMPPLPNFSQLALKEQQMQQCLTRRDYSSALQLTHSLISDLDCLPHQGSNAQVNLKQYKTYACFYNLATILSKQQQTKAAEDYLKQAQYHLQMLIDDCELKELHLILSIEHVQVSLQFSVLMSQNSKHLAAAHNASTVVAQIVECLKILEAIKNQLKSQNKRKSRLINGLIDFRGAVLQEAEKILGVLEKIYDPEVIMEQPSQRLSQICKNLYAWQQNVENNERYIRKQLSPLNKMVNRTLLGIAQSPSWAEDFHIGTIMTMQEKNLTFQPNLDPYLLLQKNKVLELIAMASAAYFTFSTELRLQYQQQEEGGRILSERISIAKRNRNIQGCKIVHLKSIELISLYLPFSSKFLSHLISSFNRNYKVLMEDISEENSHQVSQQNSQADQLHSHILLNQKRPAKKSGRISTSNYRKSARKGKRKLKPKPQDLSIGKKKIH